MFAVQQTPMLALKIMKSYSDRLRRLRHILSDRDGDISKLQLKRAEEKYQIRKSWNEMKADITNDKPSQLVESNYWDESHNWGSDSEVESDDYWHFVGRYE